MKSRKQILVVDDVTTNLRFIGEILKDDYSLSMTKSGKQALKLLEKVTPDLILLDIKMPEMDGYETYSRIKEIEGCADIPTIFLTSDTEEESKIKGFKMGIADFICKPFEPYMIRERIKRVLEKQDSKDDVLYFTYKDPDTELWNRKYIETAINTSFKSNQEGYFVLFDLKNIENLYQKASVASKTLKAEIASLILKTIRKEDIAALTGGDEFALFISGSLSKEDIKNILESLLMNINNNLEVKTKNSDICPISLGISNLPKDGCDFSTLYNKADKAIALMACNKGAVNNLCFFDEDYLKNNRNQLISLDIYKIVEDVLADDFENGPMFVSYKTFVTASRFFDRSASRNEQQSVIILFTLKNLNANESGINITEAMKGLEIAIRDSLRKTDIVSMCSENQFVLLLSNIDNSHRNGVIMRICEIYESSVGTSDYILKYEVDDLKS